MTFTDAEKLEAAEREVKQRQRVYPRWVADGRLSQAFADRQLALMRAIADDYRAKAKTPDLFGRRE
jgi:hypothetical protein